MLKHAERWKRYPELISELNSLFTENEDINKQNAKINAMRPNGEFHRLIDPELLWRNREFGLEAFSAANPSITKKFQIVDPSHSELLLFPPRPVLNPILAGAQDTPTRGMFLVHNGNSGLKTSASTVSLLMRKLKRSSIAGNKSNSASPRC